MIPDDDDERVQIAEIFTPRLAEALNDHPEITPQNGGMFFVLIGDGPDGPTTIIVLGLWAKGLGLEKRNYLIGRWRPIFLYTDEQLNNENGPHLLNRLLHERKLLA